jgi:osmotically-inducible protein OsmY
MMPGKNCTLRIAALVSSLAALALLQGCFPLVAGGIGAGVFVAVDRRTPGTYIEDEGIELKANSRIGNRLGDKAHVNVTSFNRMVLLTGEAISEPDKAEAEKVTGEVPNVRSVVNEIQIAGTSSLASRGNDTLLTSKVKARFVDAGKFTANDVKVVTEASVVYLMGLVTRQEADDAVEIARTTAGVAKVVKVFEYISAPPVPAAPAPGTGTPAPKR